MMKYLIIPTLAAVGLGGGAAQAVNVAPPSTTVPPVPAPTTTAPLAVGEDDGIVVSVRQIVTSAAAGQMAVIVEVATTVGIEGGEPPIYISPTGVQTEANGFQYLESMFANTSRLLAWTFNTPETGGDLHFAVYDEGFDDHEFTLDI